VRAERRELGSEGGGPFEILLHDCKTLLYWGLAISAAPEAVIKELSVDDEKLREVVSWWQQERFVVPPPLVSGSAGKRCINHEFLVVGRALFSKPVVELAGYAVYRAQFDAAAKPALLWLLSTLVELPNLPSAIRKLLEAQREQFQEVLPAE
jgi:hypothetical protein